MQPEPKAGALRLAKLLIWVIPLLWIVNSVIARRATGVITPHALAWGRWALAGAILAWVTRAELWQHRQELRTHARRYLLLGACGMWICGAAVYFAGQTTTMMNISLIYAASPVMIAVGSVLWLREAFSKRQALGVVMALAGVVHVVVQGQWLLLTQVVFVPGDLWIAAAATAWAAYSMLQKHWGNPMSASAQLAVICAGGRGGADAFCHLGTAARRPAARYASACFGGDGRSVSRRAGLLDLWLDAVGSRPRPGGYDDVPRASVRGRRGLALFRRGAGAAPPDRRRADFVRRGPGGGGEAGGGLTKHCAS